MIITSDLHLGVQRSGGTTPPSAQALRIYAIAQYEKLLALDDEIVINGDFFDSFQVPTVDILAAYLSTSEWLDTHGKYLWLIPGNHDLSKSSATLSSFELFARLLEAQYPDKVKYCQGAHLITPDIYAISHVPNQTLFDLELGQIPDNVKTVLLHCNMDNAFAAEKHHSLNLTREQAKSITKRGITIVMGHEHQGRTLMNDKVIIVGNPYPTSVADCLSHGDAQKDGRKYCLKIDGDDMELIPTWSRGDDVGGYAEIDWESLNGDTRASFIRVTGNATSAQGADVIKAISRFRQKSNAFVVTNAVKVEGVDGMGDLASSVEDIKSVDVMSLLLEELSEEQRVVVRKLLEEST